MVDFFYLLKARMSEVYFVIIFIVLTFYMRDGYYDTLEAKGSMLLFTTLFYVVTMLFSSVVLIIFDKNKKYNFFKDFHVLDWGLLSFAVIGFLSTLFSNTGSLAFWGSDACRIGFLHIFLLCLSCIFLSRNLQFNRQLLLIMILSGYIVFLWGITDCFDLDIMKWHLNMASFPYDYLSTIGNRDWYVGYLALLLPFAAIFFLYEQNRKMRILYGIYLFLGFISLYITKNNGNLLVFGCVILLVYYALKDRERWKHFIQLLWIFVLASFVVKIICYFVNPMHVTGISILGILQEHHWYWGLAILTCILQILGEKIVALKLEKIWLGFSGLVIAGMFVIVILHFDGSFGSDRGYIWTYTVKTFSESTIWEKLIGWGPDCFKNAVYSTVGNDIYATWPENNMIANAHNEILQYLITMGMIGAASYLVVFVSAFICALKKQSTLCIAVGTSLFAYFCTALGNNPQPLNYGILFVLFALVHVKCSHEL